MFNFGKRSKLFLTIGLVFLFFLSILALGFVGAKRGIYQGFKNYLSELEIFEGTILEVSTATVSKNEGELRIDFDIASKDKQNADIFLARLGASSTVLEGMSLEMGEGVLRRFDKILPLRLKLNFEGKDLVFRNGNISELFSGLSDEFFEYGTGSAKLKFKGQDERNFKLDIDNPKDVLVYATSSGALKLSKKISPVFPILENIDRIKIEMNGKSVMGRIELR